MQKTLSGTPTEMIQQLADIVGDLSLRITETEDHSIATNAVMQVLTGVLKDGGTLNAALWNSTLETMAETYSSPPVTVDEEGRERLKRVANAVLKHRITNKPPKPTHPSLKVIEGGKD